VVLGAGIAGLAAAYTARRRGRDAIVYEAAERAGGLLDNFVIDGFRFDTAVHLSFASEPEVREVFDRTAFITHDPRALCWDAGLWLKHPVQNNMFPLPADQKVEMIAGLAEQPPSEVNNYHDWLVAQYGRPIAERWPLVYNEKYWTIPVETLGTDWIGQRMRRADLREVLRGALSDDPTNTYYVKEMRYPTMGGYRAFLDPMIEEAEIVCGCEAVRIDAKNKRVAFANGSEAGYENLVSTIPLPRLVELIGDAPADVRACADSLFATSLDLVSIGFNKPQISPALWFYIYDRGIAAARAYSPDWKSPQNVPPGCSSLQFEIYSSRRRPQAMSPDELKANTVEALKTMGIATEADILFVHHCRLPYANVVFDLGMEERRDKVREWVAGQGVTSAGRFGEWDYLWSNQSMLSGIRAAETAFGLPPAREELH
jgi:protoporphyrinogen oxidase